MWAAAVAICKPFVLVWAGLNAFDDLALLIRVGRLGASIVPFPGRRSRNDPAEMCGVCDDVMGDLMRGNDGLSAIPCGAACLGLGRCVRMCERVQEVGADSSEFPCIAAGFCDPVAADFVDIADADCRAGAFFSCRPKQYCRRRRRGFKFSCELKPGFGRWVGMKHAAREHAGALAAGLMAQAHCGEEGAGPYCIARPTGLGLVAETIGHFITLVIGGYRSIIAIETPGGGDDRQWLTFWLILALVLFAEGFFARVLLSTFPYYYEAKLGALIWLVWRSGAETIYRKLRRILEKRNLIYSDEMVAAKELEIMQSTGKFVIERQLGYQASARGVAAAWQIEDWEYDYELSDSEQSNGSIRSSVTGVEKPDPIQQLYELSKFILSAEGGRQLEESKSVSKQNKMLLIERAASVVSFQRRYHWHCPWDGGVATGYGPKWPMRPVRNLPPGSGGGNHVSKEGCVQRNYLQDSDSSVEPGTRNSPSGWVPGQRWVLPFGRCGGHHTAGIHCARCGRRPVVPGVLLLPFTCGWCCHGRCRSSYRRLVG